MKRNTIFVVLFAMLCLIAITAAVSADNDGYNSYCNIDQYGCWVTDWDTELDEPTGKKIYVQFWSEEAREFFMGKDSDATVAPLPRKYGAAMTMVKGDEAARGAWKSGLWGFRVRRDFVWEEDEETIYECDDETNVCKVTIIYYGRPNKGGPVIGVDVYYVENTEEAKKYYWRGEKDPGASWQLTSYIIYPEDGVEEDNPVLQYCKGHIIDGGCVLPDSLIPGYSNVPAKYSGWYFRPLTDRFGNIIYVDKDGNYTYDDSPENDYVVIDHLIWANPWY